MRPSALARVLAADAAAWSGDPFRVVVADPPWAFGDALPGPGRGAAKHYELLTVDQIAARQFVGGHLLSSGAVADDAYLFLWRVSARELVEAAYAVCRAWDFDPVTERVWCKETKNGKQHFGMGRHLRMAHETAIMATRGKPKPVARNVRSVLHAVASRRHSEKPEEFYADVERLSPGPYLELFARRARHGWTCVGSELA